MTTMNEGSEDLLESIADRILNPKPGDNIRAITDDILDHSRTVLDSMLEDMGVEFTDEEKREVDKTFELSRTTMYGWSVEQLQGYTKNPESRPKLPGEEEQNERMKQILRNVTGRRR